MKISLDGHHGYQCEDQRFVNFYGLLFDDIIQAARFFKRVPAHSNFKGKYYKSYKALCDTTTGFVYHDGCSFVDMDHFKYHIKTKYNK